MSAVVRSIGADASPIAVKLVLADVTTFEELPLRVTAKFLRERAYSVGDVISDGDAEEAVFASRVCDCAERGLLLLAYTDNSVRWLTKKLCSRGYDRDCAEAAARLLSELGYINERAQIERRGRQLAEVKLRGLRRVCSDLAALGYDRDVISSWAKCCDIDFDAICARAIAKKGGIPDRADADARRRMISYLYRQGFSSQNIREAARSL